MGFIRFGYGKMFGKGRIKQRDLYTKLVLEVNFRDETICTFLLGLEFTQKILWNKRAEQVSKFSIFFENFLIHLNHDKKTTLWLVRG